MANGYIDKINTINTAGTSSEYNIIAPAGSLSAYQVDKATNVASADKVSAATAAGSAKGINSTNTISLTGDVSGENLVGTAISAAKTINTRITHVPWSAISGTNVSGAKSNLTSASTTWSTTNERFLTPNVTKEYIDSQVTGLAESAGLYQSKGNSTTAALSNASAHHNGFVYNITGASGTLPATSSYNGQVLEVLPGDNLVYLTGGTQAGWDKLADPFAVARSTLEPYSAASADWENFNSTYTTINTNSGNWNNSAHNLFAGVNTPGGNVSATTYNSTLTLSGLNGVSAGGTSPTATFGFSGVSGFKTFKVTNAGGTTANINATTFADTMTFNAGTNISLTPTVDANGNPTITINKTDTSAIKATSSTLGMVQKSYYKEVDTTNHIGTLVVQGNMSASNFA